MKEQIEGVLALPYLDKYVVKVYRQLDRFHVGTERIYLCKYTQPDKVRRMADRFFKMNQLLQKRIVEQRIKAWSLNEPNIES